MENKAKITELISQMTELATRINLETDMAAWVGVVGHVSKIEITVATSKNSFLDKLTKHSMYYYRDYQEDGGFADFNEKAKIALEDLNNVLSKTFTKKYTAYCNLIDMGCSQVFTSETAAKNWVRKMKKKYDKVDAITGIKEELVEATT